MVLVNSSCRAYLLGPNSTATRSMRPSGDDLTTRVPTQQLCVRASCSRRRDPSITWAIPDPVGWDKANKEGQRRILPFMDCSLRVCVLAYSLWRRAGDLDSVLGPGKRLRVSNITSWPGFPVARFAQTTSLGTRRLIASSNVLLPGLAAQSQLIVMLEHIHRPGRLYGSENETKTYEEVQ